MIKLRVKKAQTTIECAVIFACIVAALLAMQHYVKRGAEGRLRAAADSIGEQYDAKHINSNIKVTQSGTTSSESWQIRVPSALAEEGTIDGVRTTKKVTGEVTDRTGSETLETFPAGLYD